MLKLITPSLEYKDSFFETMNKKAKSDEGIKSDYALTDLPDQIKRWEEFAKDPENGREQYWLIMDDKVYVGTYQLRHKPSGRAPELASHVAWTIDHPEYDTDENKKALFKLGIEKVKASGLGEIIMICDKSDGLTKSLIEESGGVFEKEVLSPEEESVLRYIIKF